MNLIEVKVEELTGPALDWAVAKATGLNVWLSDSITVDRLPMVCEDSARDMHWSPSTYWDQGGPLIERERIGLWPNSNGYFAEKKHFGRHHKAGRNYGEGPTPLIAACRALVAAKLGETIQIPEELLEQKQ